MSAVSVCQSVCHAAYIGGSACSVHLVPSVRGHSVQPLPNAFGLWSWFATKFVTLLLQLLRDSSHLVRCKCLELIGALGSPDHSVVQSQSSTSALSVVGTFSRDQDGRVRTQAFQTMVCIVLHAGVPDDGVYFIVSLHLMPEMQTIVNDDPGVS